eukprot:6172563-Pleurochrysis_carterae.AAC.2
MPSPFRSVEVHHEGTFRGSLAVLATPAGMKSRSFFTISSMPGDSELEVRPIARVRPIAAPLPAEVGIEVHREMTGVT